MTSFREFWPNQSSWAKYFSVQGVTAKSSSNHFFSRFTFFKQSISASNGHLFFLFYLPYLSSIHEKANYIAILWTGSPHSLASCLFRGFWATCLSHKGGASRKVPCPRTQQANLPACSPQPPLNAERQAGKLRMPFLKSFGMTRQGE